MMIAPRLSAGRLGRIRRELAERGAEALVVLAAHANDPDLAPFVGPVHLGRSFLLVPAAADVACRLGYLTDMERDEAAATGLELLTPAELDVPRLVQEITEPGPLWAEVVKRALARVGLGAGRLALAGHLGAGTVAEIVRSLGAAGWGFADGGEVVRLGRKVKEPSELAELRAASAATCEAFRRIAAILAAAHPLPDGRLESTGEPVTIGRLRREVLGTLAAAGLAQPHGNILAPGADGGVPHSMGHDDHVLRRGEPLVVDLFPQGLLFSDCTRTFVVGEPAAEFRAAFDSVRGALELAHRSTRPGVRGFSLQEETCRFFRERGYPTILEDPATTVGYVHHLGHGIGHELHEYPSFRKAAGVEGVLEVGDAVTLEPGLYDAPAGWGVRLEDLVLVGADGNENLTPLPYDYDPKAWFP
ncbi:MAG: Xaa-Pro peptidase family protein [Thermoanaerobaculia bacterium]|nr:Xaa-Pro peptidase family protein [Thermoanaerobaculia bacterium]